MDKMTQLERDRERMRDELQLLMSQKEELQKATSMAVSHNQNHQQKIQQHQQEIQEHQQKIQEHQQKMQQYQRDIAALKSKFEEELKKKDREAEEKWQKAVANKKHLTMSDDELRDVRRDLQRFENVEGTKPFKAVSVMGPAGRGKSSFIRDWLSFSGQECEHNPLRVLACGDHQGVSSVLPGLLLLILHRNIHE